MKISSQIDKIHHWIINNYCENLSVKDKYRIFAINSFGIVAVIACSIFGIAFLILGYTYGAMVAFAISLLCSLPVLLNKFEQFEKSRILYLSQSPFFVLLFSQILGPGLGVEYFFLLLFSSPFIYLKSNELKYIALFFAYNGLCLIYRDFGGDFLNLPVLELDQTTTLFLRITIYSLLLFFVFTIFLVFDRIVLFDDVMLQSSKYEKEKANQVKHEFLDTISQELRSPLSAVLTVSTLLEENHDQKNKEALLKVLKQSSESLISVTSDIIDFCKLEANRMILMTKSIEIRKAIISITDRYRLMAYDKGLKFNIEIDKALEKFYDIDIIKLDQVLGNLISNAVKYTNTGHVDVIVRKMRNDGAYDNVYFEIVDTGHGISKENLQNLFDSAYQVRSVLNNPNAGNGLGLAIAKRLLKIYNSEISVESAPGLGSKFCFKLRLKISNTSKNLQPSIISKLLDKQLLLVEDNADNAEIAGSILENLGLLLNYAKSGKEAIEMSMAKKYDFILVDLNMPEMNGFETAQEMRKPENPNNSSKIFGVTANYEDTLSEQFSLIFDDNVIKPFQKEQIQEKLINIPINLS